MESEGARKRGARVERERGCKSGERERGQEWIERRERGGEKEMGRERGQEWSEREKGARVGEKEMEREWSERESGER